MLDQKLSGKYLTLKDLCTRYLGYPCNAAFDYRALYPFFEIPLNNIGEPYTQSNLQINTHDFEQEVIAYAAGLYGAKDNYWGYVTNGGTEGNILGIHFGRLRHPDGVVYHSAHKPLQYSQGH